MGNDLRNELAYEHELKLIVYSTNPSDSLGLLNWIYEYISSRTSRRLGHLIEINDEFLKLKLGFERGIYSSNDKFPVECYGVVIDRQHKLSIWAGNPNKIEKGIANSCLIVYPSVFAVGSPSKMVQDVQIQFGFPWQKSVEIVYLLMTGTCLSSSNKVIWKKVEALMNQGNRESADQLINSCITKDQSAAKTNLLKLVKKVDFVLEIQKHLGIAKQSVDLNKYLRPDSTLIQGFVQLEIYGGYANQGSSVKSETGVFARYIYSKQLFIEIIDKAIDNSKLIGSPQNQKSRFSWLYSFVTSSWIPAGLFLSILFGKDHLPPTFQYVELGFIFIAVMIWLFVGFFLNRTKAWGLGLANDGRSTEVNFDGRRLLLSELKEIQSSVLGQLFQSCWLNFNDGTTCQISRCSILKRHLKSSPNCAWKWLTSTWEMFNLALAVFMLTRTIVMVGSFF